jgi:expansin (peptidoglycan-binding protein)
MRSMPRLGTGVLALAIGSLGACGSEGVGAGAAGGGAGPTGGSGGTGAVATFGQPFAGGQFHLGPVDWDETQWHNACAPATRYAPAIRQLEGTLLAGLWTGVPDVATDCDACILVTTGAGKSALLRVVTYGDTTSNSIDVSPDAYQILNSGEYPRAMTWQLATCPDTGAMVYEFQTGSNEWWTSLWVRNARVPLARVEVQSVNHAAYVPLARASDGTLTDASGFGRGSFSLRSTGIDGQQIVDSFSWPGAGIAGQRLTGRGNFH